MGESSLGTPPSAKAPEDCLDSWKEFAAYLNRDVTTVQRWEKRENMPVHRHLHDRVGSVYAFRSELDAWMRTRTAPSMPENEARILPPDSLIKNAAPRSRITWMIVVPLAAAIALAIGAGLRLRANDYFWRNPIAEAKFQTVTDFGGTEQAAAVSRDGQFVAFLSDRDGKTDVWVTQVGSGQFHNLTHGSAPELANPSVRNLGFSPDGAFVTFWTRKPNGPNHDDISVWAVPTLGGQPKLYLEGVAEFDWSRDGSRLAYHTPGPGDPLFVSESAERSGGRPILTAPDGLHDHFQLWAPDDNSSTSSRARFQTN